MLESYWKGVDIKRQHERFPPHSEEWRQAKAAAKKAAAEAADSEPKLSSGKKRRSMAEDGAKTASSKASPSRDKSAKTKSNGAATSSQSEKGAKRARSPEDVSSSHKKKKARARVPETESADEVALPNEHGDSDDDEFVDVNEQASEQSLTAARNLNGELEDDEDDDSLAEGYNDDREQSNNDEKYAQEASWEVSRSVQPRLQLAECLHLAPAELCRVSRHNRDQGTRGSYSGRCRGREEAPCRHGHLVSGGCWTVD